MERTIRVTGKGKISVKPDMIRLILDLEDTRESYEETLKQSTVQVGTLKECFERLGFAKTDLKTITFNIDTEYESYRDENEDWKRRFVGYKFVHYMKIEFDADNKLLGKVLYALAHCVVKPEFRINYTVRDVESAKNRLLANAMQDSKEKAKVLAEAAEVSLGEIITIDYSWGEMRFVTEPLEGNVLLEECCYRESEPYAFDIEPEDIDVSDTVTVIWGIGE